MQYKMGFMKEVRIRPERLLDLTYVSQLTFLAIVHVWNGDLTLRNVVVVIDVIGQHTIFCETDKHTAQQAPSSCKGARKRKDFTWSVTWEGPFIYVEWKLRVIEI
jgi:hypothetical protein